PPRAVRPDGGRRPPSRGPPRCPPSGFRRNRRPACEESTTRGRERGRNLETAPRGPEFRESRGRSPAPPRRKQTPLRPSRDPPAESTRSDLHGGCARVSLELRPRGDDVLLEPGPGVCCRAARFSSGGLEDRLAPCVRFAARGLARRQRLASRLGEPPVDAYERVFLLVEHLRERRRRLRDGTFALLEDPAQRLENENPQDSVRRPEDRH